MITTVDGLRQGQLVRSISGRDQGQYYLISELIDDRFLTLVDGTKHPLANPKRKNVKHVKVFMMIDSGIEDDMIQGKPVTDARIIIAMKRLKNELEEGDRLNG